MYFRLQNRAQLMTVKDNFAHLKEITDTGDLEFEFTYTVSQREVVQRGALQVKIDIHTRNVARKQILGRAQRGQVDVRGLVNNIRTAMIDAKTSNQEQDRYTIASRRSDITATINNEVLPQLRSRAPARDIPQFNFPQLVLKPAAELVQENNPQPILHQIAASGLISNLQMTMSASAIENPQALMHDMIIRQGLDPSHILELTPRAVPSHVTTQGLTTPRRTHEEISDPATRLLHRHLFPPTYDVPPRTTLEVIDTDLVHVVETVTDDASTVKVPMTIPAAKLRVNGVPVTQVFVVFELIDGTTNLSVDSVTKILDITRHVNLYYVPKNAPIVRAAPSEISSRINLEIKQVDPGASEIEVYKKSFWVASPETDDYTLIGTYPLTAQDQSLLVQVDLPRSSPVLYRIVPRGKQSTQGFEYTNLAIKPSHYVPIRAISLTGMQVDIGIQLEVRHIPTNVVAVQFLRWNMTTFDHSPTTVGTDVGFIDDSVRQADLLVTIDSNVQLNNIYRYVTRLIYLDGHTTDYGDLTIEFIKPSPGEVDTRIGNLQVSHDVEPNVTFQINTTIVDTDLDAVKRMLERQGLLVHFEEDINKQRDQLKKLIAHGINRVDLTTGQRDNFGTVTVSDFDDNALRKNQAIGPLQYGHRYRYEVYPMLRAPETMLDSFQKEAIDVVTKKPYTFYPAKFLHPLTLNRGVMVTSKGAQLRQAKDPMAHGVIGSIVTVEVSFDEDTASVIDASAVNFDRYLNVITWRIMGNIRQVDHFLIMKQVHGIRSVLGKTHGEFPNGSCQYVHKITQHDVGSIQYIIVPIYNDYRLGAEIVTNTLIVEEP